MYFYYLKKSQKLMHNDLLRKTQLHNNTKSVYFAIV